MTLDEIRLANTCAAFEPALDYVVTKMPRFPFDKFSDANNRLGTQMKATGETMSVGRTFEESLLKGIRSLESGENHIYHPKFNDMSVEEMLEYISKFRSDNVFAIAELFYHGVSVEKIYELTQINPYFLGKVMKGNKSAQVGIAAMVSLCDCATANNTVAIIVAGDMAREVSHEYKGDPRRKERSNV